MERNHSLESGAHRQADETAPRTVPPTSALPSDLSAFPTHPPIRGRLSPHASEGHLSL